MGSLEEYKKKPKIVQDMLYAIDNDEWMWIVCWGEPRCGKSTLCMQIAHEIYRDWDKVLACIVFNLSGTIYKIKHGQPEVWPTRNLLHDRIPILIWDDFGAYSNKAITQYDRGWDMFKGAFDTLATKIAVLLANMVSPFSPTQQLQNKFTHELWIASRGRCKYDRVRVQQDFRGWNPMAHKEWLQEFDFPKVPTDVFKQYDDMRMSLAEEVLQRVEDQMAEDMERLLRVVKFEDVAILEMIEKKGAITEHNITKSQRRSLMRLKARQLVTHVRVPGKTYNRHDFTDLGERFLEAWRKKELATKEHIAPPFLGKETS